MAKPVAADVALLSDQDADLQRYEAIIEKGLETFVEVGTALLAIRDNRLYRSTYGTFEDYCRERWGMSDRRARQLMAAASVVASLDSGTIVPVTESQARPLASLNPDQQRAAWTRAVETAPNGKPTAEHVRTVVQQEFPKTQPGNRQLPNQPDLWTDDDEDQEEAESADPDDEEFDEIEDVIDSAIEDMVPATSSPVSIPSRQPSVHSVPPAPKPYIAPASPPPSDPREKQGDAWLKAFHDLFMTVNSVRDLGGLPKLTEGWKPQQKERAVRALTEVRDILNQYIEFFQGESR